MSFTTGSKVLTPNVLTATVIESNGVVTTIQFGDGSEITYPTASLESVPSAQDLFDLGITEDQLQIVTGLGLRHLPGCYANDTIINKFLAGALTAQGALTVVAR